MGESDLRLHFRCEAELVDFAGGAARAWLAARCYPLVIALRGDLGAGKTTWARAMLRGLGYRARVPSPTYTLLEHYALDGLDVVHLDLYRLAGEAELENLGLKDWLDRPETWLLIEWPERAPELARRSDLEVRFESSAGSERRVVLGAQTPTAIRALQSCPSRAV